MRLLLPLLCLLVACPEPGSSVGAEGVGAPPPGGEGGAPPPGPGGGGGPMPEMVKPGEGVVISGTVTYAGTKTGKVRIDALKPSEGGNGFPVLLGTNTVDTVGSFTVEVPKSAGTVQLVVFLDLQGDGPSSTDPAGRTKDALTVATDPVSGVTIDISDAPDLGDLAPAGPPPGSEAPPPGGTGEAGAPDPKAIADAKAEADAKGAADAKAQAEAAAGATPAPKPEATPTDAKAAPKADAKPTDAKPADAKAAPKSDGKPAKGTKAKATGK